MSRTWYLAWILVLALVVGNVWLWSVLGKVGVGDELRVVFLDVGQGDAIFIEAPNGNQVLIDGGPGKAVLRQLSAVMPWFDRSIDLIIATHPDADHISGLVPVLERYDVDYFMEPGVAADTGVYRTLMKTVGQEAGLEKMIARRGMRILLGTRNSELGTAEVYLDILFPDRDVSSLDSNDASVIARLVYGEASFLLTGDAPKKMEQYLVGLDGEQLAASVLKVGHHGSKTSTDPEFVSVVNPDYAIISVEKDSRYGHPHQATLDTLQKFKTKILNTATEGNIEFSTDGVGLETKTN